MDQPWDPDEDVPRLPRRDEPIPPPWYERPGETDAEVPAGAPSSARFSWPRTLGLFALVAVIIWVPVEFAINYASTEEMGRENLTLGFVWAIVIEVLALWSLLRLMTRR